jgi:sulfate adenylyltransferase subunit 1 (EFTu-like GTPase family)
LEHLAAKELHRNEIAFVNVATVDPIDFDSYEKNRHTGGFILIDRDSAEIICDCGLIVPRQEAEALASAWRTLLEKGPCLPGEGPRARGALQPAANVRTL